MTTLPVCCYGCIPLGHNWQRVVGRISKAPEANFCVVTRALVFIRNELLDIVGQIQTPGITKHRPSPRTTLPQDVPRLTRTHSFCGFTGTSAPPSCEDMISCFEDYDTLYDWSACIEDTVHGDMHGWLGGAWGCKVGRRVVVREHFRR